MLFRIYEKNCAEKNAQLFSATKIGFTLIRDLKFWLIVVFDGLQWLHIECQNGSVRGALVSNRATRVRFPARSRW